MSGSVSPGVKVSPTTALPARGSPTSATPPSSAAMYIDMWWRGTSPSTVPRTCTGRARSALEELAQLLHVADAARAVLGDEVVVHEHAAARDVEVPCVEGERKLPHVEALRHRARDLGERAPVVRARPSSARRAGRVSRARCGPRRRRDRGRGARGPWTIRRSARRPRRCASARPSCPKDRSARAAPRASRPASPRRRLRRPWARRRRGAWRSRSCRGSPRKSSATRPSRRGT